MLKVMYLVIIINVGHILAMILALVCMILMDYKYHSNHHCRTRLILMTCIKLYQHIYNNIDCDHVHQYQYNQLYLYASCSDDIHIYGLTAVLFCIP